jgi:hypothetical protein
VLYYTALALLFRLAVRICEKHLSRIWPDLVAPPNCPTTIISVLQRGAPATERETK